MGFWSWYKEQIVEVMKYLDRVLVRRVIYAVDPVVEGLFGLVGILTTLLLTLCVFVHILPPVYYLYLITMPIYLTVLAHGIYRDLHRNEIYPMP